MKLSPRIMVALVGCATGFLAVLPAYAVELSTSASSSTAVASNKLGASATTGSMAAMWMASDSALAQMWNLTIPEIQRAKTLMAGPRGAFSSAQLSPLEALGIHARTEAERAKYAALFARATYEDTQRVLVWSTLAQAELQRLAEGSSVLNFENVPKASVANETADMLGVPRSAVIPPRRVAPVVKPRDPVNSNLGPAVDNRGAPTKRAKGAP